MSNSSEITVKDLELEEKYNKLHESYLERVATANKIIAEKIDEIKNLKKEIMDYAEELRYGPTWPIANSLSKIAGMELKSND